MQIQKCLFLATLLAAVIALLPAARSVNAQTDAYNCPLLRERLEVNRKQVFRYETYIDIKTNPAKWRDRLGKLNRAITAGYVLSDVNDICRELSCYQTAEIDLESRLRFQTYVRNELTLQMDNVAKTDLDTLNGYLASAKTFVSRAEAALSNCAKNIQVVSATYGGNCGASQGNDTDSVVRKCNGQNDCGYVIDSKLIGDPVYGCAKDYVVTWRCGSDPKIYTSIAEPEAGRGSSVLLYCKTQ